MITFGFIRHGATEWNLAGRIQGQTDIPLSETGRKQANLLAERLRLEQWEGIISSDLIRAKETAELIEQATGTPLLGTDKRLRERDFGQLEGTTSEEWIQRWGEGWRELHLGIESDGHLLQRWESFLAEAEKKYGGKRILLVSHGGYIVPVIKSLLGKTVEGRLMNTSLTIIERTLNGWQCRLLNCSVHLEQQ